MRPGMNLLLWSDDPSDPILESVLPRLAELGFDGIEGADLLARP
jgi:sugar phosphate isomerase/epimerase